MRSLFVSLCLLAMSWNAAGAAILVYSDNGQLIASPTITTVAGALTSTITVNKRIVVTTPSAPMSTFVNMSSGRTIAFENGGCIALSGSGGIGKLTYAEPEYFCAKGDGVNDDGPASRAAVTAVKDRGGEVFFGKEKYLIGGATAGTDGIKNGILIPWSGDFYGARHAVKIRGRSEGTTLLAGGSGMAVIRASNPHVTVENISITGGITGGSSQSKYPSTYPNNTGVYNILVGPQDLTATTGQISTSHFKFLNGTSSWATEGIFFQAGPASSGAYLPTIENVHFTDNIRGIGSAAPADVASVKNLVTELRVINSYIAGGNTGFSAIGIAGATFLHTKFENINTGTSPSATPTGLVIPDNFAAGFNYGHNVNMIDSGAEGTTIPMNNLDRTTSMVNSNFDNAASIGERLISSFNKNGGEALRDGAEISTESRQVQLRLMDTINGTVEIEASNRVGGTSGALFSSYPIMFGGAGTNGTIFRTQTSLAKVGYDSTGTLVLSADPNNLQGSSQIHFDIDGGTVAKLYGNANGGLGNNAASIMGIAKDAGTNRSINAAGSINASNADFAENVKRAPGCGIVSKGDIVGLDINGMVTDKYSKAVSFMIRSTDPAYVGGDVFAEGEAEQLAFAGQVPVNVLKANPGDYIIPVKHGSKIKGVAVKHPTFSQYRRSVGRVLKVENGIVTVIVKTP